MENANQIIENETKRAIWNAFNILRPVLDMSEAKNYIITLFFYKFISKVTDLQSNEQVFIPENYSYEFVLREPTKNIGKAIDKALEMIEKENSKKLENISSNVQFEQLCTKYGDKLLLDLLDEFERINLDFSLPNSEITNAIGDAFESLFVQFAEIDNRLVSDYYTPAQVSSLLAKVAAPQSGNSIYDPACGTSSLLINAAKEAGSNNISLFGQDLNRTVSAFSKMNLLLHGYFNAEIKCDDTLVSPQFTGNSELMKFDIVLSNPPFSMNWDAGRAEYDTYKRFHRDIPPRSKADYAFISHMIESTREGSGRMGVVVPQGVLFRGAVERKIRKKIIEENIIEAIIGLPPNVFYGTAIPAVIMLFHKGKKENKDVLFIDASQQFESLKAKNNIRDEDIEKILKFIDRFREDTPLTTEVGEVLQDGYAFRATIKDIKNNDYNLNIPLYVKAAVSIREESLPLRSLNEVQLSIIQTEKELEVESRRMFELVKQLNR